MERLFSVIDTETTGLFATTNRIAEIAIVTVDRQGNIVDRWETLVNPDRDLGAQRVHRIAASDVMDAPRFEEIADEVAWRLSGTIPVAHNLVFDARFLSAELGRAGLAPHPLYFADGLCTLQLSRRYIDAPARNLQSLCAMLGLDIDDPHCAGDDAQAAAELLGLYIASEPDLDFFDRPFDSASYREWLAPEPVSHPACRLRGTSAEDRGRFIDRLVSSLPSAGRTVDESAYLDLVDRALLDRRISRHEEEELVALARDLGIDRTRAEELHDEYFAQLTAIALDDGVVTDDERADLDAVAELLGIPAEREERLFDAGRRSAWMAGATRSADRPSSRAAVVPGDLVVLTGEMSRDRSEIARLLEERGFVVHSGVTKKVKLLVAADPDSLSGKAKKARQYGIAVVGEDYLWKTLLAD